MAFIPDTPKTAIEVPYFDDVTSAEGWQGFSTTKSVETLEDEITKAIKRLGGTVISFQRGLYDEGQKARQGLRITYVIDGAVTVKGQLDLAALPVRTHYRVRQTIEKRQDRSFRMAMFMTRIALNGSWFLQQLSPGYSALMPFMLAGDTGKTITQIWAEGSAFKQLLPPSDSEFEGEDIEEGEYREVNE